MSLSENSNHNIMSVQFWLKHSKWLLGFIYGTSFILIFWSGYRFIEPSQYIDRDDGLITYSHVVHLVEYGYVGVSPSGERLEGFSNPLDFLLYLFFYGCFSTDFHTYNFWKTLFCTFGIGMVFSFFFGNKGRMGYALSFAAAVLLATNTRFMAWHGSGLENPWSNFLLLFSVWILYRAIVLLKFDYWGGLVLLLACITRAEGLYYIFPLMGIAFIFLIVEHGKTYLKPFLKMSLVVFAGLAVLFLSRYWYFGGLLPNTSLALGIHVSQNLRSVLELNEFYLNESGNIFLEMIRHNNFWYLALGLPLLYFTVPSKHILWILCALAAIVLLGLAHPFVFHGGRLDPVRYTLQLAPIAVFLPLWLLAHLAAKQKILITAVFAIGFVLLNLGFRSSYRPDSLCCDIKIFQSLDECFGRLTTTNQIHRPLLANPDLGIISIQKKYNMLDMAYLASPQLALLNGLKPVQLDYIFELAAPVILELHGPWAEIAWPSLLKDARHSLLYKPYDSLLSPCNSEITKDVSIVFRRNMLKDSKSTERIFYEKVKTLLIKPNNSSLNQSEKEDFLRLIENEIGQANMLEHADIYAPAYLNRILFQFWPEIRTNNLAADVLEKMQKFALKDLALLQLGSASNKHWAKQTAQEILRLFLIKHLSVTHNTSLQTLISAPLTNNPYLIGTSEANLATVYLTDKHVIYMLDAKNFKKVDMFYLHLVPMPTAKDSNIDPYYFDNLDFKMPASAGFEIYGKLVYVVPLPQGYKVSKIETGQYEGQKRFWRMEKKL